MKLIYESGWEPPRHRVEIERDSTETIDDMVNMFIELLAGMGFTEKTITDNVGEYRDC